MAPGAQTISNIAFHVSATQLLIKILGFAIKCDPALEFDRYRCFCAAWEAWSTHRDHDSVVVGVQELYIWFPINNFWRGLSISFKVYIMVNHYQIQVYFENGVHPQNFDWAMVLFYLEFG